MSKRRHRPWVVVMVVTLLAAFAATLVAAGGCGGGMKNRVEDAALDSLSPGERLELTAAWQDFEKAQGEKKLLEQEEEPLERDRDSADKERAQLQLEIARAVADHETAVKTRDETRAVAAARAKEVAAFGMKTIEAKLDWLMQRHDWLKAALHAADRRIDAAATKVELEKARVAKKSNIKTREESSVGSVESQWAVKAANYQSARDQAVQEEKKAKDLEAKWRYLRAQHDKLKGT